MAQIPPGFQDFMLRHGYSFAIIADVVTGEKITVGERASLETDYLVREYLDYLTVAELYDCSKNRLFPAMDQDGVVCGLLCKPKVDVMVALFANDRRSVFNRIEPGELADQELRALWCSSDVPNAQ